MLYAMLKSHTAHLVFANPKSNAKKPKELYNPTADE
jgi:hypothetical protein